MKDSENRRKIIAEMDKVDEDYFTAYGAARKCMQKIQSSETTKILTIDLPDGNNTCGRSETPTGEQTNVSTIQSTDSHTMVLP